MSTKDNIYQFIIAFTERHGYGPSVRDIATGVGVKSTNTANYWKVQLRKEGLIDYQPGISRSIVVTDAATN